MRDDYSVDERDGSSYWHNFIGRVTELLYLPDIMPSRVCVDVRLLYITPFV